MRNIYSESESSTAQSEQREMAARVSSRQSCHQSHTQCIKNVNETTSALILSKDGFKVGSGSAEYPDDQQLEKDGYVFFE